MKSAIEQGRCTKSVTGVEMFHQAFYQCLECFPDASRGLGCCASCAQTCHVAKGHKVVLRSFGSCFCDCSGSQMCCLESRMELVVKMRPQLYKDQPDEGILVCIKEFPADHEAGVRTSFILLSLLKKKKKQTNTKKSLCFLLFLENFLLLQDTTWKMESTMLF
jgi:hypothetical protein